MKKFAVLCVALLLALQASGAVIPNVGDNLDIPGVINGAIGLVGGLTDKIVKIPGDLLKPDDGKGGGLNLGNILKSPLGILG